MLLDTSAMTVDTPTPNRRRVSWYQELSIRFQDGVRERFFIDRTRSGTHRPRSAAEPAPWTRLEHHRCPGCPLAPEERHCPAALSLEQTLDKLAGRISHEVVEATAITGGERLVRVRWPLQDVGAVFVQLAVFASGCPLGDHFKPLLADLPPFSTSRELGRHLVSRLLLRHRGRVEACRRELEGSIETLRTVLAHLSRRLSLGRGLRGDAVANSIVQLDAFAGCLSLQAADLINELAGNATAAVRRPFRAPGLWAMLRAFLGI